MNKRYYTVESTTDSMKVDQEFDTYEEAYDYMCRNYVRELNEGYKPTLYKIIRHDVSSWKGTTNTMIQPVWN